MVFIIVRGRYILGKGEMHMSIDNKRAIELGETALGIEFGSTRIKASLINRNHEPIASGDFTWENRFENGAEVTPEKLLEVGAISKIADGVKLLGKGDLSKKLVISGIAVSESAKSKIEAAGGEVKE